MSSAAAAATPEAPATTVALFDLDGTLIDTNNLILKSFLHVFGCAAFAGLPAPAEEAIVSFFGEPLYDTFRRFTSDEAKVSELVGVYREFNLEQHDALIAEFVGVLAAVERLAAAGVKLAIVTSKKVATAHLGLAAGKMAHLFPVLVGLDSTEAHKPRPEPALLALRMLGEEPGPHVLMIGDSPFDIECGRNAGCRTAAVGWTLLRERVEASRPDHWIEQPDDICELILRGRLLST